MTRPDPTVEHLARLAELFRQAPITAWLKHEMARCADGSAEIRLPFQPGFEQGLGVVHGGILGLLLDTAGYFAAASVTPGELLTTVEYKVNLIASARRETLVGHGEVIDRGKSLLVCQMRATGEDEQLLAVGSGTYGLVRDPAVREEILGHG